MSKHLDLTTDAAREAFEHKHLISRGAASGCELDGWAQAVDSWARAVLADLDAAQELDIAAMAWQYGSDADCFAALEVGRKSSASKLYGMGFGRSATPRRSPGSEEGGAA